MKWWGQDEGIVQLGTEGSNLFIRTFYYLFEFKDIYCLFFRTTGGMDFLVVII
jgi:hypothetical protein